MDEEKNYDYHDKIIMAFFRPLLQKDYGIHDILEMIYTIAWICYYGCYKNHLYLFSFRL